MPSAALNHGDVSVGQSTSNNESLGFTLRQPLEKALPLLARDSCNGGSLDVTLSQPQASHYLL